MGSGRLLTITRSEKFEKELKSLKPDILAAAKEAIRDLLKYPVPTSRRMHKLSGYRKPNVYTIDVLSNHSYKISFEITGTNVHLRRIADHKTLDRAA